MKRKRIKKTFTLLLASTTLLALMLSGCGGGKSAVDVAPAGDGDTGKTASSGGQVTITHYTIDSEDRTFIEKLIPDFEAKHPNIKVKVEKAPTNSSTASCKR
ncbi:hypothetical protein VQ056_06305 [Paenibacillus sp. JTLBN-2024]